MQVQCVLCDKIESINDNSYEAKRLINKRIQSYLCQTCYDRIETNTKKRHETGKFNLYRSNRKNE
ncbi:YlaI family protein [Pseudogracilibacillus auburnensis]|uniref:Uncharacterized protein YlaI n=1 Tax=Pseudogracilibacillus auburnensis TaxID=1494959 RepID=A0A2V3W7V3_9BACI|nr:YlaI family protein [Pseudogracilibacillus auburnensis]MBO1003555.1 YlaI family protein [Pseudogracilibacillus auburnensis]PXW89244.1 uncharacterized protein YlaI [Pseudogracilibacillus auburnensis]